MDSHAAHAPEAQGLDPHEKSHPGPGVYIKIGVVLFVLTALEVAAYEVAHRPGSLGTLLQPILVPVLLLLSAAKFALAWAVITILHGAATNWQILAGLRGLMGFAEGSAQPGGMMGVTERDDRRSSRHGQAPASGSRPAATPAVDAASDRPNGRAAPSGSVTPVAASPATGGAVVQAPPVTGK